MQATMTGCYGHQGMVEMVVQKANCFVAIQARQAERQRDKAAGCWLSKSVRKEIQDFAHALVQKLFLTGSARCLFFCFFTFFPFFLSRKQPGFKPVFAFCI